MRLINYEKGNMDFQIQVGDKKLLDGGKKLLICKLSLWILNFHLHKKWAKNFQKSLKYRTHIFSKTDQNGGFPLNVACNSNRIGKVFETGHWKWQYAVRATDRITFPIMCFTLFLTKFFVRIIFCSERTFCKDAVLHE